MRRIALIIGVELCCAAAGLLAQAQPDIAQGTPAELPFRLELGGYGSHVTDPYGDWRGGQALLWIRTNPIFIPEVFFDSQTRPGGTQQNYGFFSYLNWSKSFYTTQGFSTAPQNDAAAVFFPKRRYDVKANWKLPPNKNFVVGIGYTRFDLGAPGHGQIFNAGALWYHRKLVMEGNFFVNRSQPGDLYSASGAMSVQYGQEGKSWTGITVGGGHQLYQFAGQVPFNIRLNGYNVQAFYRKWLSRHVGVAITFDYQNLLETYRRIGGGSSLFFEF